MVFPNISVQALRSGGYFVAGIAVGLLVGLTVNKIADLDEDILEDEVVDEEDEDDEVYEYTFDFSDDEINPVDEDTVVRRAVIDSDKPSLESLGYSMQESKTDVVDYSSFYQKSEDAIRQLSESENPLDEDDADYEDDVDEANGEEGIDYAPIPQPKRKHPYIIDEETFLDKANGYDKVNLTYYSQDNVLANEMEEIVTDPKMVLGNELRIFEQYAKDHPIPGSNVDELELPSLMWVRNDQVGCDYEVEYVLGSYAMTVLGIEQ